VICDGITGCTLAVLFPTFQTEIVLTAALCWVKARQIAASGSGVQAQITRGETSLARLGAAFGFGALIITQVNQSAFAAHLPWSTDTVAINLLDLAQLAYICFWNAWARNKIIWLFEVSAKLERR
jgi:uncharacterized protein (DUF2062 family)